MSDKIIYCRKGEACNFELYTEDGTPFPDQYTAATLHLRDDWKPDSTLRLSLTEADGITIDNAGGVVTIEIGATVSAAIEVDPGVDGQSMAMLVRLRDPDVDDDVKGFAVPFVLQPEI